MGVFKLSSRLRTTSPVGRHRAQTLAVASGKGGVGKTNVAVNLSVALAARGFRVVLVDADLGLANADLLLNVSARLNLSHVLSGACALEDVMLAVPGGFRLIPGASGLDRAAELSPVERAVLVNQLETLEQLADVVVIDCGAGLSHNVLGFALCADQIVVVTTPEPTAMTDAYVTVKALQRRGASARCWLLPNKVAGRDEAQRTFERIESAAKKFLNFSIEFAGYCLQDARVEDAVRRRSPFMTLYPRCPASACIEAVAGNLFRRPCMRHRDAGFFRKVVGLFL